MNRMKADKRMFLSLAAWMAAGAAFILSAAPLRAANPETLTLRVRFGDALPPTTVTDLAAAATVTEGQVALLWTAPGDQPGNTTVTAYELRYATFVVTGSTTAWWNAATTYAPMAGYVPAAPGAPETFLVDGLGGGTTYYFAIRSRDAIPNWSDLDDGATGGNQASAFPRSLRPAPVAGLLSLRLPDTSVDLNWNPVEFNENGTPATDILDYIVRRSASFNGPFTVVVSSGAGSSSFSVPLSTAPVTVEYIQIVALDASGNESDPALSNILEVTPRGIIGQMAVAPGTLSRTYLPASLMDELRTPSGDLLMRLAPNATPSMNRDPRSLATYDVSFVSPVQDVDKNFTLPRPAMNVVLQSTTPVREGSVGVMWWNGNTWIKMGQVSVDELTDTVSFYTSRPGTYQIRSFLAASELTLDKASVFPRIFTPNGDGINDEVLFALDNPKASSIEGKIYDVGGNEVADLKPAGAGAPTPDTLSWNGRDRNGTLARAGVYIYLIKGEGKSITGTVVVAK